MKPLSYEEMLEKVCPMSISSESPTQTCIGKDCMMLQKQYKIEGVRGDGDIDFKSMFKGFYCALAYKRSKR